MACECRYTVRFPVACQISGYPIHQSTQSWRGGLCEHIYNFTRSHAWEGDRSCKHRRPNLLRHGYNQGPRACFLYGRWNERIWNSKYIALPPDRANSTFALSSFTSLILLRFSHLFLRKPSQTCHFHPFPTPLRPLFPRICTRLTIKLVGAKLWGSSL